MKSRYQSASEMILLYRLPEDTARGKAIRRLLESLQMPWQEILPEHLSWTAAERAGYVRPAKDPSPSLQEDGKESIPPFEAMILCGLTKNRLDQLLAGFRKHQLEKVERKAMLTPTNQSWPLNRLLWELDREHQVMNRR